jgi:glycerate kinase
MLADDAAAPVRVLVAPDKLRGTASARQAAAALAAGVADAGGVADACPLSDGGDGFLDTLGGGTIVTRATDPLGRAIDVPWRLDGDTAVVETALASGLALLDRPGPAEAEAASSIGSGEVIAAALRAGARRILVGVGGSAFSDGGRGALAALADLTPFPPDVRVIVACDVRTAYLDAARVYGPQKGADPPAVERLTRALGEHAAQLQTRYGRDVRQVSGAGAAGGLAGALYAAGATLQSGFGIVAELVGLRGRIAATDLVVTAEGRLDATSLSGKVVGGVLELAAAAGRPVAVIAGSVAPGLAVADATLIDLSAEFGGDAAWNRTAECLRAAAREHVTAARG